MIDITKFNCTGCSACYATCPTNAIKLESDERGFIVPIINKELCINCGLCSKVCPMINNHTIEAYEKKCYAVKYGNLQERKTSQSGGAFAVLTDYVLELGGVIYGAYLDDNLVTIHGRASTKSEANKFKGSKYVQSDMRDIFRMIKKDLCDDRYVLFGGTPCQVAGLSAYLNKKYEKLLLVDLICHGVPSPLLWKDYLKWQETRNKREVKNAVFRVKENNWGAHYERLYFDNKSVESSVYTTLFYSHNVFRKCCSECKFASLKRYSDMTIGDYWGIDIKHPEFRDGIGVSVIITNTQKGQNIFSNMESKIEYIETSVDDAIVKNPQIIQPSKKAPKYDEFWEDYENNDFDYIVKKYAKKRITLKRIINKALRMLKLRK